MSLDFLEWSWFILHSIGAAIYIYIVRDAIGDMRASRPEILELLKIEFNGRRGIYAAMYLRIAVVFLVLHVLFALAGIAAILTPNPPGDFAVARTVSAFVSIVLSLLMDAVGVLNLIDRSRIRNYKGPIRRQ